MTLRERVRAGQSTRGTFLNLGSAGAAEVCALAGFDWLLVDLEHGAGGEDGLVAQLLAGAARGVPVFARAESSERIRVGHVLDLGAQGVMFPRLDTPDQVREALAHLWYPPQGDRGIAGYNRARQFGGDERDNASVNESLLGIVQIETAPALQNVREIASIPGVDVLFVGPSDLSMALGIPGQFDHPTLLAAFDDVIAAARDCGIAAGILAVTPERVGALASRGFSFIGVGSDASLLRLAAKVAAQN
ncbi:MAG TPA: aldolase/citrate lyase family protein [Acidimicrobiales bacterium]|nr:aldolase/citrate lyase family protein [Acidimicrobiales bacterium]